MKNGTLRTDNEEGGDLKVSKNLREECHEEDGEISTKSENSSNNKGIVIHNDEQNKKNGAEDVQNEKQSTPVANKNDNKNKNKHTPDETFSTFACSKEGLVPLSRPKKRKKKEFVIDNEEESKPTYTRKTKNGGYAHTNLSRSKISKANSGNTPWNYGKKRSSADKSKIAAGVRARNRTVLLKKLKTLGMTEEEWDKKKKEIKYLRERVRRFKKANLKIEAELNAQRLQDALDATDATKKQNKTMTNKKHDTQCDNSKEVKKKNGAKKTKIEEDEKQKNIISKLQDERTNKLFPERIKFRPFSFTELEGMDNNNEISSDKVCKVGGPGGLICCEDCSREYNKYLMQTLEDVETQRITKEAEEVTEIVKFLKETKDTLKRATDSALTKAPPLPSSRSRLQRNQENRVPRPRPKPRSTSTRNRTDCGIDFNVGASWNLTSAVDIGIIGGFASI